MGELISLLKAHRLDVVLANQTPLRGAATAWTARVLDTQPVSLIGTPQRLAGRTDLKALLREEPVILADRESDTVSYSGLAEAMADGADVRIFGKPITRPYRRMGVALANGPDTDAARATANEAASKVTLHYPN